MEITRHKFKGIVEVVGSNLLPASPISMIASFKMSRDGRVFDGDDVHGSSVYCNA